MCPWRVYFYFMAFHFSSAIKVGIFLSYIEVMHISFFFKTTQVDYGPAPRECSVSPCHTNSLQKKANDLPQKLRKYA